MTRVELLRDLDVRVYERSSQEYLAIRQELADPDPLRLAWRELIKKTIREVVLNSQADSIQIIERTITEAVSQSEQEAVMALIVEELRRLHEGVLARYGLKPSDYQKWRSASESDS